MCGREAPYKGVGLCMKGAFLHRRPIGWAGTAKMVGRGRSRDRRWRKKDEMAVGSWAASAAGAVAKPCSARGVPKPHRLRMRSPRLKAAA